MTLLQLHVNMTSNRHGYDLTAFVGEEIIAMGVCCRNRRRDWKVSRIFMIKFIDLVIKTRFSINNIWCYGD